MSNNKPLQITTPVGRLVSTGIYEGKTTDYEGKPLVVKTGPNAGKPRTEFSFGVAFQKTPGVQHWANEPWLQQVWAMAHQAFPNGETQRHDFAWKIIDGDSTIPNKRNIKPCDREGYPGNWVIWFSSGTAPRVYNANGTQLILEKDAVKPGYYIQVFGNVTDNKPSASPGLYWNHSMIAFAGVGPEIQFGPDVSQAGFGQGVTLPPGATAYTGQPVPPAPGVPVSGAGAPPPPAVPGAAANVPPPPAPPGAVAPPPAAPAAPAKQMTAKAAGQTYEAMIAAGWTDAMLIEHGYMLAPAASVPAPLPAGSATLPAPPAMTAPAAPPLPVTPNADIRTVPARTMLPAANGATYESLIAAGWTDALLIQHGMMAA